MPNLPSPERRTRLKYLSHTGNTLQQNRAQRPRGTTLAYVPCLQEITSSGKSARVYFLNEVILWLGFVNRFDDTFEPGSSQTLVYGVCEMAPLPWFYELALYCFSLIWKRRNSSAKAGFSSKEVQFGVPFLRWKHRARNQCSERRRKHIGLSPENV